MHVESAFSKQILSYKYYVKYINATFLYTVGFIKPDRIVKPRRFLSICCFVQDK